MCGFMPPLTLVHSPSITWPSLLLMESLFKLRRVESNPAIQCAMINFDASLCHHLLDIPVAKGICTIPPYTLKNNFLREVSRFKTDHMELLEVKLSFNIIVERPECDKTVQTILINSLSLKVPFSIYLREISFKLRIY